MANKVIKIENQKSTIEWTSYLATAYAEGFCEGEGATLIEQLEAWAVLIQTRLAYSLQGFFGRTASNLIQKGIISEIGVIDWEVVESMNEDNEDSEF